MPMKKLKLTLALLAGLALAGFTTSAVADDTAAKETTITGNMVCGKCTLHETKSCQNVIQVEKDGKTVNYYLAKNDVSDAMHEDVCHGDTKKMTATGTVTEKDGKEILTATKLEAAK
jgi:Family of unknown function (DUF6370)